MSYREVVDDLRQRGDRFHNAANEIERLFGPTDASPAPTRRLRRLNFGKRAKRLHAQLTGTSGTGAIVLGLLKDGARSLSELTEEAKVSPSSCRTAVLALEQAGRITRDGNGRSTKYRLTKARKGGKANG